MMCSSFIIHWWHIIRDPHRQEESNNKTWYRRRKTRQSVWIRRSHSPLDEVYLKKYQGEEESLWGWWRCTGPVGIRCSACCRSCKRHICSNQWSILFISAPIAVVLFNGNHLDTMKEVTWHSLNTRLSGNVLETTYYSKVPGVNSLRSRTMVYYDIQYGLYYRQVPLSIHDQHDQTETHYADSKFNYTRRIRLLTIF